MTELINNTGIINSTDLWEKTLHALEKKISHQNLQTWFHAIRGHQFSNGTLILIVPSKYYKDWISSHFLDEIVSTVEELTQQRISVQFRIDELQPGLTNAPSSSRLELVSEQKDTRVNVREVSVAAIRENQQPEWDGINRRLNQNRELNSDRQGSVSTSTGTNGLASQISGETYEVYQLNPKYTFDSFVVGTSNRLAQAAAMAVAQSPAQAYNPLFLYGGVGLGKTHLMQAIGHYVRALNQHLRIVYTTSEQFMNAFINSVQQNRAQEFKAKYRNIDVLIIDDIQFIAGKEQTQEVFFHTFNTLYETHKQIVVSSDRPPKEIPTIEERLRSRFEWGLIADIQPPDFETRVAILKKKAYQEKISIPNDVTYYIADNIKSNIRELEGGLIRIAASASLTGHAITLETAKTALHRLLSEKQEKNVDIDLIQKTVALYYNISIEDLCGQKRSKGIVQPRQVAMYLSRTLTKGSFPEIGREFGKRDHTTVIHACNKIEREMEADVNFRRVVNHIIQQIKE